MKLSITEADHKANQFWTLASDVKHEVPPQALFDALPEEACERDEHGNATHPLRCYMVDLCDDSGDILADKEVSEETVLRLLDEPIEDARAREQDYWDTFAEFVS